jgi:hypothetical protein
MVYPSAVKPGGTSTLAGIGTTEGLPLVSTSFPPLLPNDAGSLTVTFNELPPITKAGLTVIRSRAAGSRAGMFLPAISDRTREALVGIRPPQQDKRIGGTVEAPHPFRCRERPGGYPVQLQILPLRPNTERSLSTPCHEIGDLLAKGADQFLETDERLGWVEARLDAYREEVLQEKLGSIAWSMCILVSERFGIGEDYSRRILQSRLHDAIDEAKIRVALRPAYFSSPAPSRARGNLSRFEEVAGKLMVDARKRHRGRKLPKAEIVRIADELDSSGFKPTECLEGAKKKELTNYNEHKGPQPGITTCKRLAFLAKFHPLVRRRLAHVEKKYRETSIVPSLIHRR